MKESNKVFQNNAMKTVGHIRTDNFFKII